MSVCDRESEGVRESVGILLDRKQQQEPPESENQNSTSFHCVVRPNCHWKNAQPEPPPPSHPTPPPSLSFPSNSFLLIAVLAVLLQPLDQLHLIQRLLDQIGSHYRL